MSEAHGTAAASSPERMISVHEALEVYTQLFRRITMTRAGITFAGARDLYETLGYKRDLRFGDYLERYRRGGIAARIVNALPAATWRLPPTVHEIGKADETAPSAFETAWTGLVSRLDLWHVCARADRLAALGHYAVVVLGLRGQVEWNTDVTPVRGPDDLLYLTAFAEQHALILELVSEPASPLFGRPLRYMIDFSRRGGTDLNYNDGILRPILGSIYGTSQSVHASRLLHLVQDGLEDDIVGTPRLRAVWNYLDDLEKVVGGSAEMFWQDAKRRIVLNIDPMARLDDPEALAQKAEEFIHGLRNFLDTQGMTVTQLAGTIPDPRGNVESLMSLIAGTSHVPQRILIGNEQGKLASEQDENNWALAQDEHIQGYAGPMLRALIDCFTHLRILPVPAGGYRLDWPNRLALSETERATIAKTWTETLALYAGTLSSPQDILPLALFLTEIMEFTPEQADRIQELLGEALVADGAGSQAA